MGPFEALSHDEQMHGALCHGITCFPNTSGERQGDSKTASGRLGTHRDSPGSDCRLASAPHTSTTA